MLFDPDVVAKFADCGVYMMDEPDEVVPAVLNFIGEDPNSHDTDVIAKVEPVLLAIRPHIRRFHNSAQINDLANGDICLSMGWSGDMLQARDRAYEAENGVDIAYVIPDEGALSWFDMMAIPADAPHPGNAHKFIDYILRPEVIAKASNYVYYANGNAASTPLLDAEITEDPGIYPTDEARKGLYVTNPYPLKVQRFITRMWTRIKGSGIGPGDGTARAPRGHGAREREAARTPGEEAPLTASARGDAYPAYRRRQQALRRRHRGRRRLAGDRAGRVLRPARPLRLRQDDTAAHARRLRDPERRRHHARRRGPRGGCPPTGGRST